jgi:sorbitol-6-phosphate 2-dehydrogenase
MMSWLELENKVTIVTGGALGIGRAVCEGLAAVGAHCVVADVNVDGAQILVDDLTKQCGSEHLAISCDVSSKASVDAMIAAVVARFGSVDIMVNNAGILIPRLLVDPADKEELTEAIWDKTTTINMKGTFLCAQAAARVMIKSGKGGVILNMSSESSLEGSQGQSVYAATKAAQYSLTRSWSKELGVHGIRVVGLAPGILEATALRSPEYERAVAYTRGITVEQLRATYEKVSIPLGRPGKLKEVADAVCFFASDRASYFHGTTVNLSGGKSRG